MLVEIKIDSIELFEKYKIKELYDINFKKNTFIIYDEIKNIIVCCIQLKYKSYLIHGDFNFDEYAMELSKLKTCLFLLIDEYELKTLRRFLNINAFFIKKNVWILDTQSVSCKDNLGFFQYHSRELINILGNQKNTDLFMSLYENCIFVKEKIFETLIELSYINPIYYSLIDEVCSEEINSIVVNPFNKDKLHYLYAYSYKKDKRLDIINRMYLKGMRWKDLSLVLEDDYIDKTNEKNTDFLDVLLCILENKKDKEIYMYDEQYFDMFLNNFDEKTFVNYSNKISFLKKIEKTRYNKEYIDELFVKHFDKKLYLFIMFYFTDDSSYLILDNIDFKKEDLKEYIKKYGYDSEMVKMYISKRYNNKIK